MYMQGLVSVIVYEHYMHKRNGPQKAGRVCRLLLSCNNGAKNKPIFFGSNQPNLNQISTKGSSFCKSCGGFQS